MRPTEMTHEDVARIALSRDGFSEGGHLQCNAPE